MRCMAEIGSTAEWTLLRTYWDTILVRLAVAALRGCVRGYERERWGCWWARGSPCWRWA